MNASIITIGDEILIGQTTDTNSGFIAKALDNIGIQTVEMISIGDLRPHILDTLKKYQDEVSVVIITGGLGPTKDDITKKTLCEYFGDQLVTDNNVLAHVTRLVESFYNRPITDINREQALVPSKAIVLPNEFGTAPGMWFRKGRTVFISLPGVPFEMKGLMKKEVIPRLMAEFDRPVIIHKNILTHGVGESLLAERISAWEERIPPTIRLAYLPSPGGVKLRLTIRGRDREEMQRSIDEQVEDLEKIIGDCITGYDSDESLEVAIGRQLSREGLSLSVAESCTGGAIASRLTSVPGSSSYFKGGIIAYETGTKSSILGVDQRLISEHSVVSAEVASAMAEASRKLFNSDFAIATTGNAGPSKGDSDAEVGTVFIAVASRESCICSGFQFGQPREKVVVRTVNKSLEILRQEILKNVR